MNYQECVDIVVAAGMAQIEKRMVVVDPCKVIELCQEAYQPHLGCATTRELRQELVARGEDSPDDYRTFEPSRDAPSAKPDGEPESLP